jgi:hypothetical protein
MKRSDIFNIATTMHMANYIICLIFKIRTFFITTFFAWLFVRNYILPICDKTCMTASFHYARKFGPKKLVWRLHMLLARKSSGHIYVCLVYRLCLCAIFLLDFGTVPTVWYFLSFILSLSWHVKCIIALCTVVVTYKSIYINHNVVIVNTNRNKKELLFKSLFSVYCFVDHFRLLVPVFHLVVVLSISLKEQFEDTKGVVKTRKWRNRHYNDKQWSMKHYTEN